MESDGWPLESDRWESYTSAAADMVVNGNVGEIASALAVRDAATAMYIAANMIEDAPLDKDVIAWLLNVVARNKELIGEVLAAISGNEVSN